MTKTSNGSRRAGPGDPPRASADDVALERALEGLFRLGANRRFDARQSAAVGAVVTRAGYAVLRSLADHEHLSLRQAADICAMDAATASRQLVPLVDQGLVQRQTSGDDARSIELRLTTRGREVYDRIVDYRLAHLTSTLRDWPDADRRHLSDLVVRLVTDLTNEPLPR